MEAAGPSRASDCQTASESTGPSPGRTTVTGGVRVRRDRAAGRPNCRSAAAAAGSQLEFNLKITRSRARPATRAVAVGTPARWWSDRDSDAAAGPLRWLRVSHRHRDRHGDSDGPSMTARLPVCRTPPPGPGRPGRRGQAPARRAAAPCGATRTSESDSVSRASARLSLTQIMIRRALPEPVVTVRKKICHAVCCGSHVRR